MWIIFALGASLLWGLTYVIDGEIYRGVSVATSLSIASFFVFLIMLLVSWKSGNLRIDIGAIASSRRLLLLVIAGILTLVLAELCIGLSIQSKSATLAGLIEISYPIFIALFAYLLFRENQVRFSTAVGGILIFLGVFVIYYFNK